MQPGTPNEPQRLYSDLAWLWPIISPPDHYVAEALEFVDAIRKHARIEVRTLLDLGCGGGHNDHTLCKYFQVTGVDLSQAMLALARKLNPDVTYLIGDMRSLHLGETFDAVIVADSISYMLTEQELGQAFATAYEHLQPGGVFCTYAEETPDCFEQNGTYSSTHVQGDVEVALVENYYDPDQTDTTYEMTLLYLIRRSGRLTVETDCHRLGIFPVETWLRLLRQAGFQVQRLHFKDGDCPMFVGIK
jgi:SAM-dependent methyltransferase